MDQVPLTPEPADQAPFAAMVEVNCPEKLAPVLVVPNAKFALPWASTLPETAEVPVWLLTQVPETAPLAEIVIVWHVPLSAPLKVPAHEPAKREVDGMLVDEALAI